MRALGWVVAFAVGGGCYRPPSDAACTVTCATDSTSCPGDLVCTSGVCTNLGGSCTGTTTVDAPVTITDGGPFCYGTPKPDGRVEICLTAVPTNSLLYTGTTVIDTMDASECLLAQQAPAEPANELCVIAAKGITIADGAKVSFTGPRAVVLLAVEALTIDGTLDVSSPERVTRGAGSRILCIAGPNPTVNGGGAGGTGTGQGGSGGSTSGGFGGTPPMAELDVPLVRGGCPGQSGGGTVVTRGAGGPGGGAVYLISDAPITVTGTINASGAGGGGAGSNGGGGGGGAGGLIAFDAPALEATNAHIVAHGGGGGCGGGSTPGGDGARANPLTPQTPAFGCAASPLQGGSGGVGSFMGVLTGTPGGGTTSPAGGGGGGGASGAIRIVGQVAGFGANASPPPEAF